MAAISSQGNWKQAAMQRAERLTDLWDVIKAWAGRAAEIVLSLCMFAQLIGVLPGVHYWPWVDNFILAVQVIMLDMGAFALHTLAEQARESGKEEAANQADRLATFLIRLMITTIALIIIGQVSVIFQDYASTIQALVRYAEVVLILVRVMSTVKYIHTIHSLRSTSEGAALNSTQVATLEARMQEQVAKMTEAFQTPPTLDYEEIARLLLPLVAQEVRRAVPDTTSMVEQMHQLRATVEALTVNVATPEALNREQESNTSGNPDAHIVDIEEYRHEQQPAQQPRAKVTRKLSTRTPKDGATKSAPNAKQKALKVLQRNPDLEPVELARKAGISRQYASKILKEV